MVNNDLLSKKLWLIGGQTPSSVKLWQNLLVNSFEDDFVYTTLPYRIVFAVGAFNSALHAEVTRMSAQSVLLVSTPGTLRRIGTIDSRIPISTSFVDVEEHVPGDVAMRATNLLRKNNCDLILSIGGGSTTGTAKAVALNTEIPIIAVPTTYAGSEVTPVVGTTTEGVKKTVVDPRVLPKTVVYDPLLTLHIGSELTLTSSFNSLAHAFSALASPRNNPVTDLFATSALREINVGLKELEGGNGQNLHARTMLMRGSFYAGLCLAQAGTSFHHRICHVLGGTYGLSHSNAHASLLPYSVQAMMDHIYSERVKAKIVEIFHTAELNNYLIQLSEKYGSSQSLRDLGISKQNLLQVNQLTSSTLESSEAKLKPIFADMLQQAWLRKHSA